MQIIPVIDVRHGQAVRAVRGDRSNYRPIVTPLAASADPLEVARGYLRLFPFQAVLYRGSRWHRGAGRKQRFAAPLA